MLHYNKIIALIISLIIISIAFIIFSLNLVNVSINDKYQQKKSDFIKNEVLVQTNYLGIPFINAENDDDLFFAVGYYQASMRLWQMDYFRRLSMGQLSEIFGKETVKIDKFMRCFEIEQLCKNNFDSLSAKSRSILEAYAEGVNYYIKEHSSELSFEFNALSYKPKEWAPYQSLMIGKLLTFELSLSIWADVTFGEIIEKLGAEKLNLFLPNDSYLPTIYNSSESSSKKGNKNLSSFSNEIDNIRDYLGIRGTSSGSNCWAITNTDTNNNNSLILANDTHLMLSLPARWMQMKIKSPEIEAFGMTMPGIPLIMSGRNKDISWGITNIMIDGFDYFIEKLDKKGQNYLYQDTIYKPIINEIDTIKIANDLPEVYYKQRTVKSIIISDFHILKDTKLFIDLPIESNNNALYDRYELSFNWVGNKLNDEIFSLYKINTAKNFDEFKYALRDWSNPGLNFHYLDKKGNIGTISAGEIPVRATNCNPNIPNPAWDTSYTWRGTHKLQDSIYSVYNPEENFLASANNKLKSDDEFVSNYWEPDSRIKRITELLEESDKYTYRDAQYMQYDYLSVYSRELLGIITGVLDNFTQLMTDEEKQELEKLKNWDYIFSRGSHIASLYTFIFKKLVYNTFYDELGERLYRQYTFITSIYSRKIMELLNQNDSEIFDIQGTKNIENKEFIIFKSFREGINEYESHFVNIPEEKRSYGSIHTLTLEHPFSRSEFLKYAVDLGPYEMGGNNTTLNNGEFNMNAPYKQVIGASMRIINDLSTDLIYSSLPGGMSGDPIHPNYSDQIQIWLNGGYLIQNFYDNKNSSELSPLIKFIPN